MRIDANSAFISVLWLIVLRNRKCTLSVGFTNGLALPGYTVILRRPRITQITTYGKQRGQQNTQNMPRRPPTFERLSQDPRKRRRRPYSPLSIQGY